MTVNIDTHKKDNSVRSNFIRTHLMKEIFHYTDAKKKIIGVPGNSFVYFDEPIESGSYKIDRFGKGNFYLTDQVLPVSWSSISGKILLSAYNKIKSNKVFILKNIHKGHFSLQPVYVKKI